MPSPREKEASPEARKLLVACNRDKGGREAMAAYIIALEAECNRLTSAIRWALGEDSEFAPLPEGRWPGDGKRPRIGRYYWRTELRQRAALSDAVSPSTPSRPNE